MIVMALEGVRLRFGWICFGLRSYEAHTISALMWGTVGIIMVFIAAPSIDASPAGQGCIAIPIIMGLGIVDPLSGELKYHGVERPVRYGSWWLLIFLHLLLLCLLSRPK